MRGNLLIKRASNTLALFTLFTLFTLSCQREVDSEQHKGEERVKDRPTPVEVQAVDRGSISSTVKAVSIMRAKERASVRSLISGLIKELYVEEGDVVHAQQKLAHLTRPGAKSLIQKAMSAYKKSRRDVKRLSSLVKRGLAPKEDLDQAKFTRDQNGLELTRLRQEAKSEQLTSPIDGVVVKRLAYRGEVLSPGQLVYEVMDLSIVYAPLQLPDRWVSQVNKGMSARIYDRTGRLLTDRAEVSHVSPIIDADTGTFTVWVSPSARKDKDNLSDRESAPLLLALKPGLFVSVEITLDKKEDALLVSRDAIIYRDGEPLIAQVSDRRVKMRRVKLGYEERDRVEVLSPLQLGDQVITFGQRGLEEGTLVRPIDPVSNSLSSESEGATERFKR